MIFFFFPRSILIRLSSYLVFMVNICMGETCKKYSVWLRCVCTGDNRRFPGPRKKKNVGFFSEASLTEIVEILLMITSIDLSRSYQVWWPWSYLKVTEICIASELKLCLLGAVLSNWFQVCLVAAYTDQGRNAFHNFAVCFKGDKWRATGRGENLNIVFLFFVLFFVFCFRVPFQ